MKKFLRRTVRFILKNKITSSITLCACLVAGGMQSPPTTVNNEAETSKVLKEEFAIIEDSNQEEPIDKDSKKPLKSTHIALNISPGKDIDPTPAPSKFSAGSKARGAAKKNSSMNSQTNNSPSGKPKPGKPIFVHGFTNSCPARPAHSFIEGLSNKPLPHLNTYSGGPRSITVLSAYSRKMTSYEGVKGELTDNSNSHLTSKHAHEVMINHVLPPNPDKKRTVYPQIRTRINIQNKKKFADRIEMVLQDLISRFYPDVLVRGIRSQEYIITKFGRKFFVGIHLEGDFEGEIKTAHSLSAKHEYTLEFENKID